MDVKEKCEEVMKSRGWTQRRLAQELGLAEQNLTHIMKGRRGITAHALIKLERLRGVDDHSIIEQLLKTAACIALASVTLILTTPANHAEASMIYSAERESNANYRGFGNRVRRMLSSFFKLFAQAFCRQLVIRST